MARSEQEMAEILAEAVSEYITDEDGEPVRVRSFAEAGLMTSNQGIVITIDGEQFQVSVVRR